MGRPRKVVQAEQVEDKDVVQRPTAASGRSGRTKRTPINGYRNILSVEGQEPGYHYCWVTGDNVPRFQNADYEFVTHDVVVGDKRVDAAAVTGGSITIPGGNGETLHLMRVLEEYYKEDMGQLHSEIDEKERSMRQSLNNKDDGRYGEAEVSIRNRVNGR